jgi:hypothetical protein
MFSAPRGRQEILWNLEQKIKELVGRKLRGREHRLVLKLAKLYITHVAHPRNSVDHIGIHCAADCRTNIALVLST